MKITIVQREIEEAVRAYIHSQIAVKDGHTITMEFSATRGEDGLIAAIDISPSGDAPTKQVSVQESSVAAEAPKQRVTRAAVQKAAAAPAAEEATETVSEPASEPVEAATSPIADPEPDAVEDVEGAQPLKRSIFAGLQRPVNGQPEDTEAAA